MADWSRADVEEEREAPEWQLAVTVYSARHWAWDYQT